MQAHSSAPWFVSMVGFVAGLPFLFQMVERPQQIEVPKYLRPRTDTPKLTIGHGGCFSCIYSVRGAGGYQMFGITPAPIFDPEQKLRYLKDIMVSSARETSSSASRFHGRSTTATWRPSRPARSTCASARSSFSLQQFLDDPAAYNAGC